jgi:hypothetical protein
MTNKQRRQLHTSSGMATGRGNTGPDDRPEVHPGPERLAVLGPSTRGYYNAKNKFIKNKVNLGAQTTDSYSLGSNLSDASIRTLVSNHIANGDLPATRTACTSC